MISFLPQTILTAAISVKSSMQAAKVKIEHQSQETVDILNNFRDNYYTDEEHCMSNIKIFMKDGSVNDFPHEGRPGGSWTKTISYEGEMAIVTDEYNRRTAYPVSDIKRVVEEPSRRT